MTMTMMVTTIATITTTAPPTAAAALGKFFPSFLFTNLFYFGLQDGAMKMT
jgi:hypothetical protein